MKMNGKFSQEIQNELERLVEKGKIKSIDMMLTFLRQVKWEEESDANEFESIQ